MTETPPTPPRGDDGDPVARLSRRLPIWTAKVPTWVYAPLLVALADWLDRTELTWVVPALRSVETDRLLASAVLGAALAIPGALQRWRPAQTLAMVLVGAATWPAMLLGLYRLPLPWLLKLPLAAMGLTAAVTVLEAMWRKRWKRGALVAAIIAGVAVGTGIAFVLWLAWRLQVPGAQVAGLRLALSIGLPAFGWSVVEAAMAWLAIGKQPSEGR